MSQNCLEYPQDVNQFLSTIASRLSFKTEETKTKRHAENFICKVMQKITNGGSQNFFHDTWMNLGYIVSFVEDDVQILCEDGKKSIFEGCIFNRFPFGYELLPLKEIGHRMGLCEGTLEDEYSGDLRMELPCSLMDPSLAIFLECEIPDHSHICSQSKCPFTTRALLRNGIAA